MRFHEIDGEEDIVYKTFAICLHFISRPTPTFRENLCNRVVG